MELGVCEGWATFAKKQFQNGLVRYLIPACLKYFKHFLIYTKNILICAIENLSNNFSEKYKKWFAKF